ncbi:MAG: hypothetical protein JRH16_18265 [Deltaproteobacteria bacterium]|nr:hypothetical protein [Deltaproteobacteria bacterium]MBW2362723.1 hypothetical protein [Deltaproteobacteria bacterium]
MTQAAAATLDIRARDLTGQKKFRVSSISRQSSVGEVVRGLLGRMSLGTKDRRGQALEFRARNERTGRQLLDSELIGDVVEHDDELVLTPRIHAG